VDGSAERAWMLTAGVVCRVLKSIVWVRNEERTARGRILTVIGNMGDIGDVPSSPANGNISGSSTTTARS
jgi:hypothetical protein